MAKVFLPPKFMRGPVFHFGGDQFLLRLTFFPAKLAKKHFREFGNNCCSKNRLFYSLLCTQRKHSIFPRLFSERLTREDWAKRRRRKNFLFFQPKKTNNALESRTQSLDNLFDEAGSPPPPSLFSPPPRSSSSSQGMELATSQNVSTWNMILWNIVGTHLRCFGVHFRPNFL